MADYLEKLNSMSIFEIAEAVREKKLDEDTRKELCYSGDNEIVGRIDSVNIDDDTVDMAEKLFMLSEDSMFHAKILGLVLTARDFEPAGTIGKLFESVRGLPETIETYESDDDKK